MPFLIASPSSPLLIPISTSRNLYSTILGRPDSGNRAAVLHVSRPPMTFLRHLSSGISHWFSLRKLEAGEDLIVARWPLSIAVTILARLDFGTLSLAENFSQRG